MADMFCNTPSFDPGSKVSDFMDSNLSNTDHHHVVDDFTPPRNNFENNNDNVNHH